MANFSPQIMGILNATPDSFYDQGKFFDINQAVERACTMYAEGADIIDVGGESTRPGAKPLPDDEELIRVIPLIKALKSRLPIPLSIDTRKATIAARAIKEGASFINDVSGFRDPKMIEVAATTQVKIVVMHMLETPDVMQKNPYYAEGVVPHLLQWFEEKVEELSAAGIKKKNIILDPGIGFGKTVEHNLEILHNLQRFKMMGFPVLLGLSRKSFMGKVVNKPPSELLPTTIAMNTFALLANVDIIRVHDVAEHHDVRSMLKELFRTETSCA